MKSKEEDSSVDGLDLVCIEMNDMDLCRTFLVDKQSTFHQHVAFEEFGVIECYWLVKDHSMVICHSELMDVLKCISFDVGNVNSLVDVVWGDFEDRYFVLASIMGCSTETNANIDHIASSGSNSMMGWQVTRSSTDSLIILPVDKSFVLECFRIKLKQMRLVGCTKESLLVWHSVQLGPNIVSILTIVVHIYARDIRLPWFWCHRCKEDIWLNIICLFAKFIPL